MRNLVLATAMLLIALAACSNDTKPATKSSTGSDSSVDRSTFTSALCASVADWMTDLVASTNAFSDASPQLSAASRRDRYLAAFDDLTRVTDALRVQLGQLPSEGAAPADVDAVRAALVAAVDEVKAQIADNRAQAAGLADAAYALQAVNDGHLFTGSEKALSTVFKSLNEQGRAHALPDLDGTCGRR